MYIYIFMYNTQSLLISCIDWHFWVWQLHRGLGDSRTRLLVSLHKLSLNDIKIHVFIVDEPSYLQFYPEASLWTSVVLQLQLPLSEHLYSCSTHWLHPMTCDSHHQQRI